MSIKVRRVDYFYTTIHDRPGESYRFLQQLVALDVNLLAFTAIPIGSENAQIALFPEHPAEMISLAHKAGFTLDGPHGAFMIQGDDELGALVAIHEKLFQADINVYASAGVTDGRGAFGYIIYVKNDDIDRAAEALGV